VHLNFPLSGKAEAQLAAAVCSSPPKGRARWTLELSADELVRLTERDNISRETVRRRDQRVIITVTKCRPREAVIRMHKFHVGQLVQFNPDRGERWTAPGGLYEVTKQLPHNGREYRYRIKSVREEHERTAGESQLTSA
jgi:hypothetical protein